MTEVGAVTQARAPPADVPPTPIPNTPVATASPAPKPAVSLGDRMREEGAGAARPTPMPAMRTAAERTTRAATPTTLPLKV